MAGSLYMSSRVAESSPSNVRPDAKASPLVIMTIDDQTGRFAFGRRLLAEYRYDRP